MNHSTTPTDWESIAPRIIGDVAIKLMPPDRPVYPTRGDSEIRFGKHGSFVVNITDGVFIDFKHAAKGGLLDMVCYLLNLGDKNYREAARWLVDNGYLSDDYTPQAIPEGVRPKSTKRRKSTDTGRLDLALKYWSESTAIPYTQRHPARRWSTNKCSYPGYKQLPPAIRYHGSNGWILASLAPIREIVDAYPELPAPRSVQSISIDKQGNKRGTFKDSKPTDDKRTWGAYPPATPVFMIGDPSVDEVYIAEGVKDALSLHSVSPDIPVIASIGGISKLANCKESLQWLSDADSRVITIYQDNEPAGIKGANELLMAISRNGGDAVIVEDKPGVDPADAIANLQSGGAS